ncbi:cytidylate kinase family protein [Geomesophilobacter sediminis]|uniref:Cytidylate kinase family protein n=1 Tax=Geomesophilobacter sediminis TaxID=2798584 RepID=A0A8J7M321_9BACT|nr:cytidylate kinase family protein [Geomesophilobacter sediminis]MBJ6727546.1 cytidylate kinase family protein [Geomesophilobacter sediminis]
MAIITISRQMGTGAYAVSKELAKRLKYTLVDRAKVEELAPKYGLTTDILDRVDEKPPAYRTAEDRLQAAYLTTVELILLDCAKQGNVILYGRGGQDLLEGMGNVLRVRFIAPFEDRVEKLAERDWIDPELARVLVRKSDHQLGGYIHFYFNRDWSDPLGYDLLFNTTHVSQSTMVDSIVAAVKDPRLKEAEEESAELLENIILAKRVEAELLKSTEVNAVQCHIIAEEGLVTISGHVQSEEEIEAALKIAAQVSGVTDVESELNVMSYRPGED